MFGTSHPIADLLEKALCSVGSTLYNRKSFGVQTKDKELDRGKYPPVLWDILKRGYTYKIDRDTHKWGYIQMGIHRYGDTNKWADTYMALSCTFSYV